MDRTVCGPLGRASCPLAALIVGTLLCYATDAVMEEDHVIPASRLAVRGNQTTAARLAAELARRAVPGELFVRDVGTTLRCTACAHRCVLADGRTGACGVRENRAGQGFVPYGYVARRYVRSVETNTVYHVEPGALALTFGMYGCDLRCPYCHNWRLSQALREEDLSEAPLDIDPRALVDEAANAGCRVVCAAYNEPMITAEWIAAVFTEARARGMKTMVVSDGHSTAEALAYMRPWTDVFRVDLKGYEPAHYKALGGRLEPVLGAIEAARALGYWVEVVTLVVPGFNDDVAGLRGLAKKLVAIDPGMPWHLNAFQPRYKMRDRPAMRPDLLVSVAGAAYAKGLHYVYVGNTTGAFGELEHTRCPKCHATVIERRGYLALENRLVEGRCPGCAYAIPGSWA